MLNSTGTVRWRKTTARRIEYYELACSPRVSLQFYTRKGGVYMPPYHSLDTSPEVGGRDVSIEENTRFVLRTARLSDVVTLRQVHSDGVVVVAGTGFPSTDAEGDALVTSRAGIGLGMRVADCLPIYFYCEDPPCVGIAHCGWRGTVAHLAWKTAQTMMRRFSLLPGSINFSLGPCVCADCYEVGEDVRRECVRAFPVSSAFLSGRTSETDERKYGLDLRAANRWLLIDAGLKEVEPLDLCSMENPGQLYSVRRDRTTGRNLALIVLRPR